MLILGMESSCDETAVAIVEDGRKLRSSVIASSAAIHKEYGGVVPEIASRMHVEAILPVLETCLREARCQLSDLSALAVTQGPGLAGALLVGISAAKGLAMVTGLDLVGVHHIAAHIAANYLAEPELQPPFLCLVVSGGHSQLILVEDYLQFRVLASTRDDAAGEAFDKVSRAVGLGYPGGPLMDKMAKEGNPDAIRFPKTHFANSLDFSFSGVKTAALTYIQQTRQEAQRRGQDWEKVFPLKDFVASYQEAILQVLLQHAEQAIVETGVQHFCLAGGVSANSRLRELAEKMTKKRGLAFTCPPLNFCTDNAAMVASLGYYQWRERGQEEGLSLNAKPHWPLASLYGASPVS